MNSLLASTKNIFKDKDGHIVLWQAPNYPIVGWILCKVVAIPIDNPQLESGLYQLGAAFLLIWAYLEITTGVNTFRKILGILVFGFTVASFFK